MKIRSFLAFDITDEVKKELASIIQILEPKAKGVKWVKPVNMHCTLKFFGNIEEEFVLGDVARVIEDSLSHQAPIHLKSVGVGVFPNWRYPRVIWAGLTGETEAAIALHEKLETSFEQFGISRDKRNVFRMHLTLGRAKLKLKNCEMLTNLVEKLADREFGEIKVDHLTLYKSVLTREGPIYTALRTFPMGGSKKEE